MLEDFLDEFGWLLVGGAGALVGAGLAANSRRNNRHAHAHKHNNSSNTHKPMEKRHKIIKKVAVREGNKIKTVTRVFWA